MKRNVQSGRFFSHSRTLADLCEGDVVENDMDRGSGLDPLGDVVEEGVGHLRAVPLGRPAADLSGGDVERGLQASGAVPPVVADLGLGVSGLHRQSPLRLPERLYLVRALTPVHREDHRVVGRVDVEADDVAHLEREPRVAETLNVFTCCDLRSLAFKMTCAVETTIPSFLACARTSMRSLSSSGSSISCRANFLPMALPPLPLAA